MKVKFNKMVIFIVILLICGLNLLSALAENKYIIPGDARRGWHVFSERGCSQCHGMGEQGRVIIAPDLSKNLSVHLSSAGLAAEMWNHAPKMWEKMSEKWVKFNRLSETEMADMFAYLYFIRSLDEPGNAGRGKEVLKTKKCTECHSIGESRGKIGPDLAVWKELTNPILWVQMMWNHAQKMKHLMDKESFGWPKLGKSDIADIIAYIKSLKLSKVEVSLAPGDSAEGREVFSQKGCERCHATQATGTTKGPNLGIMKKDFPTTIGQFAGLMWNHFPEMSKAMEKENIKIPELSDKDIANITAYLFSIRYFDPVGDRAAGKKLFQEKQCNVCHDIRKDGSGKKEAPNLARLKGLVSPIYMATALWNHGPQMIGRMKEKNIKWQQITDKELINIMEYFNKGD